MENEQIRVNADTNKTNRVEGGSRLDSIAGSAQINAKPAETAYDRGRNLVLEGKLIKK